MYTACAAAVFSGPDTDIGFVVFSCGALIEDGIYEIIVGASATDERLKAKVRIKEGKLVNL